MKKPVTKKDVKEGLALEFIADMLRKREAVEQKKYAPMWLHETKAKKEQFIERAKGMVVAWRNNDLQLFSDDFEPCPVCGIAHYPECEGGSDG
jgi:hypothetical protein